MTKHVRPQPTEARLEPGTVLISEDGTYPGVVCNSDPLDSQPRAVYVRWYKWGWNAEDTIDGWEFWPERYPLDTEHRFDPPANVLHDCHVDAPSE